MFSRKKAVPHRAKGFTLLEVLVALGVLSIMLLALVQAYMVNIDIAQTGKSLWKVILYAQNESQRVTRLERALPISLNQGVFQEEEHPLYGTSWKRRVSNEEPLPGIRVRRIEWEYAWEENGVKRNYELVSYVLP